MEIDFQAKVWHSRFAESNTTDSTQGNKEKRNIEKPMTSTNIVKLIDIPENSKQLKNADMDMEIDQGKGPTVLCGQPLTVGDVCWWNMKRKSHGASTK